MAKKLYREKLLDPRWQKKRLEILDRDEWTCQMCGDKDTTFHIHHFNYATTGNPWDSPPEDLITYCKHCHSVVERNSKNNYGIIMQVLKIPYSNEVDVRIVVIFLIENESPLVIFFDYLGDILEYRFEARQSTIDTIFHTMRTFNIPESESLCQE